MPYTHAFGPIRSFTAAVAADGVMYVITGGGEGHVRTWRLYAAGKFEPLALLEGHVRAVTCLLLNGEMQRPQRPILHTHTDIII